MSKFGWSLPPGCTQRHIDEAYGSSADEALYDKIYDIIELSGVDPGDEGDFRLIDQGRVTELIFKLCGEVYSQAYRQGQDDAHQAFGESGQ